MKNKTLLLSILFLITTSLSILKPYKKYIKIQESKEKDAKSLTNYWSLKINKNLNSLNLSAINIVDKKILFSSFRSTNLEKSSITGSYILLTDLKGSIFRKSTFDNTTFSYSDISNANLTKLNNDTNNKNIVFKYCEITKSRFDKANLSNFKFNSTNLNESYLDQIKTVDAVFEDSYLNSTIFRSTSGKYKMIKCNIRYTRMNNSNNNNCYFKDCSFIETDMSNSDFSNSIFVDCYFDNVNIKNSNFKNSSFSNCKMNTKNAKSANFNNVKGLNNHSIRNINLMGAINTPKNYFNESDIKDLIAEISNNLTDREFKRMIEKNKEILSEKINKIKKRIKKVKKSTIEVKNHLVQKIKYKLR